MLSKRQTIILDIEPKLLRKKLHEFIDTEAMTKLKFLSKKNHYGIITKHDFEYQKKSKSSLVKVFGTYKSTQPGKTEINLEIDPGLGLKPVLVINLLIISALILAGLLKSEVVLIIVALLPILIFTINFLKLKRQIKRYDFESLIK